MLAFELVSSGFIFWKIMNTFLSDKIVVTDLWIKLMFYIGGKSTTIF